MSSENWTAKNLKEGDKVYVQFATYNYTYDYIGTVVKITSAGNIKVTPVNSDQSNFFNSDGYERGGDVYNRKVLREYTEERALKLRTQKRILFLNNYDFKALPVDKLQEVWNIVKSFKNQNKT
jgi:hypothetical protein